MKKTFLVLVVSVCRVFFFRKIFLKRVGRWY